MIGRGEGQDVDAFATVEQFLIRGLDAAGQLCVVGLPRSGSWRSAWPLPKSPEYSLNRGRRPGCRLERKGLRFAEPASLAVDRRKAAELNQAGLVRVKRQRKFPEPFAHCIKETVRSKPTARSSA
jgi:hypothetical protein